MSDGHLTVAGTLLNGQVLLYGRSSDDQRYSIYLRDKGRIEAWGEVPCRPALVRILRSLGLEHVPPK